MLKLNFVFIFCLIASVSALCNLDSIKNHCDTNRVVFKVELFEYFSVTNKVKIYLTTPKPLKKVFLTKGFDSSIAKSWKNGKHKAGLYSGMLGNLYAFDKDLSRPLMSNLSLAIFYNHFFKIKKRNFEIGLYIFHQSNGLTDYNKESRSWNRLIPNISMHIKQIYFNLSFFIPWDIRDNTRIGDQLGRASINLKYKYRHNLIESEINTNLKDVNGGSILFKYTKAFPEKYIKINFMIFHGKGQVLASLDHLQTTLNVGISFYIEKTNSLAK